jgi:hypothetical protein
MKSRRMCGICSTHGRDENIYNNLVLKPEENIPLGRPGSRWECGSYGNRVGSWGLDSSGSG